MKTWMWFTLPALALALAPSNVCAQPRVTSLVTDTADVLPADQEAQLLNKLERHHASTGVPIAVLTVQTTNGERIEDFSLRAATQWRQSFPGAVNAVLYTIAVRDHHHRLDVTDGLRPRLSDARAREILDAARPSLRSADYYGAIRTVMDGVVGATYAAADPSANNGTPAPVVPEPIAVPAPVYVPPPRPSASSSNSSGGDACAALTCVGAVLLIVGLLIGLLVRSVGRTVSQASRTPWPQNGTTYGYGGGSTSSYDNTSSDTSSSWSSSYDNSSSSFTSTDYSSSSSSTDYSSSSGGGSDFSGGGASSDW